MTILHNIHPEYLPDHFSDAIKLVARGIEGLVRSIAPVRVDTAVFADFKPCLSFFFKGSELVERLACLKKIGLAEEIISSADKVAAHRFNLLGSGEVSFGEKIRWNYDFKNNYSWRNNYYKNIKIIDMRHKCDIKVPWELSRFQHLPCLGQAYRLTGYKGYMKEFKSEILDWINDNPVGRGVNWACAMEAAIRAVSWITAYYYFEEEIRSDREFCGKMLSTLYLTGCFISENLEVRNEIRNNHYLCDMAGLVWLGLFFRGLGLKEEKWLKTGLAGLIEDMDYQVYAEGTSFEASIPYHRFASEIFLSTTILAERNKVTFPKDYSEKLRKMCRFIMHYTKPGGLAPQIGDADDGRFHILTHYGCEEKRDHRHVTGVGGEYFDDSEMRAAAGTETADAIWMLGGAGRIPKPRDSEAASDINAGAAEQYSYRQIGCYIFKTSKIYILIRCGIPDARSGGGHAHSDILSFELDYNGHEMTVDPGTYVYSEDPAARNEYRSSAFHSTLSYDDSSTKCIAPEDLFRMPGKSAVTVEEFSAEENGGSMFFSGTHRITKSGVEFNHRRDFIYNSQENRLIICDNVSTDALSGQCSEKMDYHLYFGTEIVPVPIDKRNAILTASGITLAHLSFNSGYRIQKTFVSHSYGRKTPSHRIKIAGTERLVTELRFFSDQRN